MKDTFIIRSEWYNAIAALSESEQAQILKNLFEYHAGNLNKIGLQTLPLQLVWSLIEPNLKRNIDKYDHRCETSALNGLLGGRPPKNGKPKKPNSKPNLPIETLNDSDNDSDINNTENKGFKKFKDWIKKNAPNVAKMKEPFTEDQYIELKTKYKIEVITEVLSSMHNHKPLLKNNISAYLTLCNWIARREAGPNRPTQHKEEGSTKLPGYIKTLPTLP